MKTLDTLTLEPGTPVLLRVDINEPVDRHGFPQSTYRIEKILPTIQYLQEKQARVILIGHLGSPEGKEVPKWRFTYMAKEIQRLLGDHVQKIDAITGTFVKEQIEDMDPGEVVLLENLRFDKREKSNSDEFARELSELAEVYVNDAFSVCHRSHTSIVAITKWLPSYAGFRLQKEIDTLSQAIYQPEHPAVAIIGGAKIDTKLPVIKALQPYFDTILVGGKIANEYLDQYPPDSLENVIFPVDFEHEERYDIGPETIKLFIPYIHKAKTLIWNGPLGLVEKKPYDTGTIAIAKALSENPSSYSVVGGGETVDEIYQLKAQADIDFISTGGGAMLDFIGTEGDLPGIQALKDQM